MKALIKTKQGKGAEYIDAQKPTIKEDEILLKIHRTSICGSDIPIFNDTGWATDRIKTPFIFGHEFCGEVVEVGAKNSGIKVGDFVSAESHIYCGHYYQCKNGQQHVCSNMKILGIDTQGGFAEYAKIPANCAWKHTNDKFKDIGSIFEPLGNAVYATLVEPVKNKSVLITGCGPQGLFACQIAKAEGASVVIAVEMSPFRKKMAEDMGADVVLDPNDKNILEQIKQHSKDPSGVDIVVEMSGHPDAINMGLKAVKPAGRFTAFGLAGNDITIDYSNQIVFKGVTVYGIAGRRIWKDWEKMDELLNSGKIDPSPVITHTYKMSEFEKAFEKMQEPDRASGKIILIP